MAPQPVTQPCHAPREFWMQFQDRAALCVREVNAIAGTPIWLMTQCSGTVPKLRIESTSVPADSIECWFDLQRGILVCTPGAGINARKLRFQVGKITLEQAVTEALDLLVR